LKENCPNSPDPIRSKREREVQSRIRSQQKLAWLQPGEDPCESKPGAPDPVLVWIDTQILQKGCRGLQSPLKQVFPTNPTGEEEEKEQENYHQTTPTCFIKPPKKISRKEKEPQSPICCLHTSFFIIPKPSNTPNKKSRAQEGQRKAKEKDA